MHRSHGLRGNASVDALRPVPQERHNCIPTLERGNDSLSGAQHWQQNSRNTLTEHPMSKYDDLVKKLKEIFQIDRPELDFGVYRILNARVGEINDYLENRLKAKVAESLDVECLYRFRDAVCKPAECLLQASRTGRSECFVYA